MKMKLSVKDLIAIGAVMILSFPVMYFVVLYATGNLTIQIGPKELTPVEEMNLAVMRQSARRDSLSMVHSKTFSALKKEREELQMERERLTQQQERLGMAEAELESEKEELIRKKKELEGLVQQTDELDKKRVKQLAKVYAAMRADEAAQILETLDDALVARVLSSMTDDRQKAKILSSLSKSKARRISKKIQQGV